MRGRCWGLRVRAPVEPQVRRRVLSRVGLVRSALSGAGLSETLTGACSDVKSDLLAARLLVEAAEQLMLAAKSLTEIANEVALLERWRASS